MFIRMREEFYKVWLRKIIRNSTDNIDRVIIVCQNLRLYMLRKLEVYIRDRRSIGWRKPKFT